MKKDKNKIKIGSRAFQRDSIVGSGSTSTKKNLDFALANKIIRYLQQEEKF